MSYPPNIANTADYVAARQRQRETRAALPGPCEALRHNAVNCRTYDPHHVRPGMWCQPCLAIANPDGEPF